MEDTRSILEDSVYAPLELPNYSLHNALILVLTFNGLSMSVATVWNLVFATYWMSNKFHRYGLIALLHFFNVAVTVIGGFFMAVAIIKASARLLRVQLAATTLNWLSTVLCAIAGTTFLAAGRMECVKWAKFRYYTAHDIDAWKFKTVGCQQQYFIVLAVVNWIALVLHSGAIYSIFEYQNSLQYYPQTIALESLEQQKSDGKFT